MQFTIIDRRALKREVKAQLSTAQGSPKVMVALYLGTCAILSTCISQLPSLNLFDLIFPTTQNGFDTLVLAGTFLSILVGLISSVLSVGFTLYCMRVRNGERVEYLDLLDGFSFAGSIISLLIRQFFFIWLWSMLFVIPGLVASYRYRFAMLNLCQNPDCTPKEAMALSKVQTTGYKMQLLSLDFSYLGWMFLASLPLMAFNSMASASMYGVSSVAIPAIWVQMLIYGLWDLVVSMFYFPTYHTCEVAYFEIACKTHQQPGSNSESQKNIWE